MPGVISCAVSVIEFFARGRTMRQNKTQGMMKIGEIAKIANTSISTVKYYVSQGLIDVAFKTSANMAYYNPSSVQRILLIKKLQKEKFYPLSLIKMLLGQSDQNNMEIDLMDAIQKVTPSDTQERVLYSSAPRETGLTRKQIDELIRCNIISSVEIDRKKVFSASNVKIMQLAKRRLDGGMPFEQTLLSFSVYEQELRRAVEGDVDAVIAQTLMKGAHSTQDMAQLIRLSDETLDEFIKLKRGQLNRYYGSRRVEDLTLFLKRINDFIFTCLIPAIGEIKVKDRFVQICRLIAAYDYAAVLDLSREETDPQTAWAFQTLTMLAKNCNEENIPRPESTAENVFASSVENINSLLRLGKRAGLAVVIPTGIICKTFFAECKPPIEINAGYRLFIYYVRLAFLYLAPPVLGCGILASEAVEESLHYSMTCIEEVDAAKAFTEEMLDRLKS